jgi:uncharacterized membrane protein
MPADEPLSETLHRLSQDGREWMRAEAALARAEVSADSRRLVLALCFTAGALATAIGAVALLSFAAVAYLAPYVGGLANACICIGVVMAAIAIACALAVKQFAASATGVTALARRWGKLAAAGLGGAK